MVELERLSKAEIVARFDGIDDETLALGRCAAVLEPLARKRYDHSVRRTVVDRDAQVRVLQQLATRFGLDIEVVE